MTQKLPIVLSVTALVVAVLGVSSSAVATHFLPSTHVGFASLRLCTKAVGGRVPGARCGAVRGVKANASVNRRKNKFVAANSKGRVPDADMLDGLGADQLAPIMRGQRDLTAGGTTMTASGQTQTSSVSITAPRSGFLVVSGNIIVRNDGALAVYLLVPRLDGNILGIDVRAGTVLAANGTTGDTAGLAYTGTVAVAPGSHTVTQTVGPETGTSGTRDFFYNGSNLTVLFVPGNQGAITSARPGKAASRGIGRSGEFAGRLFTSRAASG